MGLLDTARNLARRLRRWLATGRGAAPPPAGAVQRSQPPAHWVERVRRDAPALLEASRPGGAEEQDLIPRGERITPAPVQPSPRRSPERSQPVTPHSVDAPPPGSPHPPQVQPPPRRPPDRSQAATPHSADAPPPEPAPPQASRGYLMGRLDAVAAAAAQRVGSAVPAVSAWLRRATTTPPRGGGPADDVPADARQPGRRGAEEAEPRRDHHGEASVPGLGRAASRQDEQSEAAGPRRQPLLRLRAHRVPRKTAPQRHLWVPPTVLESGPPTRRQAPRPALPDLAPPSPAATPPSIARPWVGTGDGCDRAEEPDERWPELPSHPVVPAHDALAAEPDPLNVEPDPHGEGPRWERRQRLDREQTAL